MALYLGRAKLLDPLGGFVGGAHDKLVVNLHLETIVFGDNEGLEHAGVLGIGVDGLKGKRGKFRVRT